MSDLADKIAVEVPGATRTQVEQLLATLVAQRVLLTTLHPPMEATDPLDHVIEQLAAAEPHQAHGETMPRLRAVRDELVDHGRATSPSKRRAARTAATQQMAAIHTQPEPQLAVDSRAAEAVQLPPSVAREAETAAAALVALSPHPYGNPAWHAYHTRFLERYGSGTIVPLFELTNAEAGLGFPAGYRGASAQPPVQALTERDRTLLRLAQQAAFAHEPEVLLDDERLAALTAQEGDAAPDVVPHTELRFQLQAPTTQALLDEKFTLVVTGAARQAGTLTGRFLHLFDRPDRERMVQALSALPTSVPGARLAQVACPPLAARTQHVARAPAVFPRIALGEHPADTQGAIALQDLAVTADHRRLWLVSVSRGCVVEPVMLNAVEFRRAIHPLARFLCEITNARAASCKPFEWGAAETLPFRPRLRYRRTVLAPARWNLTARDLPGREAAWPEWEQAWSKLRSRLNLPDATFLGEQDQGLRLDLSEPAHTALLRRHLNRTGHAELTESPDAREHGWIDGRAHEIVLPMATTRPAAAPPPTLRPGPIPITRHRGHTPGDSPWLYARLYAHPDRHDDILTAHLPALLEDWREGPAQGWWFVRYHEPEPHLRLRLRLHDADRYGAAAQRLGAWSNQLMNRGLLQRLVLDTYYPETGRFGTGLSLQAAEQVFAADSAAVLAQLAVTTRGARPHRNALTTASFVDLAAAFTGGLGPAMDWFVNHPPKRACPRPLREVRDEVLRLADPDQGTADVNALSGGQALLHAWQRRRVALATYRARLAESGGPDVDQVLASLLHLHHTRMVGIDPDGEGTCLRFARAAALSWKARKERSTPSSR